ncbi:MAG: sulfite exporter TauE/SafE family protein, partial [Nitrosospira sp.]
MKIRNLDLTRNPINVEHQQLGLPPVEEPVSHPETHPLLRTAMWFIVLVLIALILFLTGRFFLSNNWIGGWQIIGDTLNSRVFWSAVVVGFFAQVVDGALGMAYGVTATTFLLATGASPGAASASVHIAEIFTTGVSGISHAKFGNVNKQLFVRLLVPGILGGVLGAILVTQIDGAIFKPYISTYLLLLGIYILSKAFRPLRLRTQAPRHVGKLALFGGFVDAAGGGGWGPVVTSTLVSSGNDPRTTIGSVNFAEFFLTLTSAAVFSLLMET